MKLVSGVKLADPAVEPTDDQLEELFKRAFEDAGSKHRESLARLRTEIAQLRIEPQRRVASVPRSRHRL